MELQERLILNTLNLGGFMMSYAGMDVSMMVLLVQPGRLQLSAVIF